MTVCSERPPGLWLPAGADPERVVVTGQPRFDFYAKAADERPPGAAVERPPTVLFLSYLVDAYHPSEGGGEPAWAQMHRETEEGLWELARRGWRVVVKPHPQQDFEADRRRIRAEVGDLLDRGVHLTRPGEDLRPLLVGADVIVGFQTTGLFEA